jgi:hypothetical protein
MNDRPTNDGSVPVPGRSLGQLSKSPTMVLGIALLCNVAWIGFLSWLVIRTTQFVVAGL